MKIAVIAEKKPNESRVAATPDSVKRFIAIGAKVVIEAGCGEAAQFSDDSYLNVGAEVVDERDKLLESADLVITVNRPPISDLTKIRPQAILIGMLDPYGDRKEIENFAKTGVTSLTMEYLPRISRAQGMDVLSSQANIAGYRAVIEAANCYERALPMMMTAAGTVPAARAFIMGAGVAGLQAIATAKRLGASVSASDVRPAAKEQVASLGAKFVALEDEEFKQAESTGGYAKEMSKDYQQKQAELVAKHIAKQNIVITTALIPGRPAPKLITTSMIETMTAGSIIVDLAIERGGNCELAKLDKIVDHNGVKIIGYANLAGRVGATASSLYARNIFNFVETMIDDHQIKVDWDDELIKATLLTKDATMVNRD